MTFVQRRLSSCGTLTLAALMVFVGAPGLTSAAPDAAAGRQRAFVQDALVAALQRLTAPDGSLDDRFGDSVAIDGDTAAIGAPNDDVGGLQNRGSVYIFSRIGSTWTFQTTIAPSDPKAGERFGTSLALNGVTLVVGTSESTGNVPNHGSAYVFVGSGPSWVQQQKLTSVALSEFGSFGESVDVDGSTIVVGASGEPAAMAADHGAAHVFVRIGATWTLQQRLFANDGAPRSQNSFGSSVAIQGNRVIVGAPFTEIAGLASRGAVYFFTRSNVTWSPEQRVAANDGGAGDVFGFAIALDGTRAVVGAVSALINGNRQGAAYVRVAERATVESDGLTHVGCGAETGGRGSRDIRCIRRQR